MAEIVGEIPEFYLNPKINKLSKTYTVLMKIYQAKKGVGIKVMLVVFAFLPFIKISYDGQFGFSSLFMFLLLLTPFLFVSWVYFGTFYWIENGIFYYRSGFLKGNLEINQISRITKNKTSWSGVKPAMASKGLVIKMKYDEVYIAPEDNEEVIRDLLNVNSGIKIDGF